MASFCLSQYITFLYIVWEMREDTFFPFSFLFPIFVFCVCLFFYCWLIVTSFVTEFSYSITKKAFWRLSIIISIIYLHLNSFMKSIKTFHDYFVIDWNCEICDSYTFSSVNLKIAKLSVRRTWVNVFRAWNVAIFSISIG